jgi:signal transduction histidine kinase
VAAKPVDLTKHVNVIADEIKRLDQVVVGFLKFARPDELKLQPVHLASLVSEVVSMTAPDAERRNITIKTECPSTLPEINADPGMLQQALLNLAINACQAMPEGGTLRIACRPGARRRVELDIEDTGVGIPDDALPWIFEPYRQAHGPRKGTGLGLAVVKGLVEAHGGTVGVRSELAKGSCFTVTIPKAGAAA